MGLTITIVSIIIAVSGVSLFSLYSARKSALLNHIKALLKHMRSMDSWDNRSEVKLFQWMCESDEGTLHYRSLLELKNILNSLFSYWAVHFCMDEDVESSPEATIKDFNKEPEKWSLRFIVKELFSPEKPRLMI